MNNYETQAEYTLADIVNQFSGKLDFSIQGDQGGMNRRIIGVTTIQDARSDRIAFLVNPLYKKYLATTQAAAVILNKDDAENCPVPCFITKNPYYLYANIAALFDPRSTPLPGIHPSAVIYPDCEIDPTASIGANCVLEKGVKVGAASVIGAGSVIGEYSEIGIECRLAAHVTLYDRVSIGNHVQIASGVVIGSDGFGIAKEKGLWHKVPQLGRVIIEDHVEIGANCTIDRGAIDNTVIEKGVKLDNLIQVGHNVRIGENTAIAGCVGISGSAVIGKNCLIGGAAGIGGHITIADNVVITGMTAVSKSIREPGVYSSGVGGLVSNLEWRKNSARLHRLDQLTQRVKSLEAALSDLTERK